MKRARTGGRSARDSPGSLLRMRILVSAPCRWHGPEPPPVQWQRSAAAMLGWREAPQGRSVKREDWKQQLPKGLVLVKSSDEHASIEIPLGHGAGRLLLSVSLPTLDDRQHASFQLRWDDRPGDPVSVSPDPWFGKNYLTHARLNVRTGEIEPGYQQPIEDEPAEPSETVDRAAAFDLRHGTRSLGR